jgi:hypothetical protein
LYLHGDTKDAQCAFGAANKKAGADDPAGRVD